MYLQSVQNPGSSGSDGTSSGSSSSSSSISAREMALHQASSLLPTLHEDSELITTQQQLPGKSADFHLLLRYTSTKNIQIYLGFV